MARPYAVCTLFVGVGRSGKTYAMVKELVEEVLPNETGHIWHNLPLYPEKIADYLAKKTGKPREEFLARLHAIPEEALASWRSEESGPWDFFSETSGNSISNCRIWLDEAHHYWPQTAKEKQQKRWQVWVGELGHPNASIRFLTQDLGKLSECAAKECAMRYLITNSETERDPFFKVLLGDYYELTASLTGQWLASCWIREDRKVFTRNESADWQKHRFSQSIFDLYDSHSKPVAGGQSVSNDYKRLYKLHSFPWVASWFIRRNGGRFVIPAAKFAFVIYLVCGGMGHFFNWVMGSASEMTKANFKDKSKAVVASGDQKKNLAAARASNSPTPIPDLSLHEQQYLTRSASAPNQIERDNLQAELELLRAEVAAGSEVGALMPDRVIFKDGSEYEIAETIRNGPFKGRSVTTIQFSRREITLDDGTLLRVGWKTATNPAPVVARVPVSGTPESAVSAGGVRSPLQRTQTVGRTPSGASPPRRPGDSIGRFNAGPRLAPFLEPQVRPFGRDVANARRPDSDNRSEGAAVGSGPDDVGTEIVRPRQQAR